MCSWHVLLLWHCTHYAPETSTPLDVEINLCTLLQFRYCYFNVEFNAILSTRSTCIEDHLLFCKRNIVFWNTWLNFHALTLFIPESRVSLSMLSFTTFLNNYMYTLSALVWHCSAVVDCILALQILEHNVIQIPTETFLFSQCDNHLKNYWRSICHNSMQTIWKKVKYLICLYVNVLYIELYWLPSINYELYPTLLPKTSTVYIGVHAQNGDQQCFLNQKIGYINLNHGSN